jgi:hypothetical protein
MFLFIVKLKDNKECQVIAKDENEIYNSYFTCLVDIIAKYELSPLEAFLLKRIELLESKVSDLEYREESRANSEYYSNFF